MGNIITQQHETAGILGNSSFNSLSLLHCFNVGVVDGIVSSAGIIGHISKQYENSIYDIREIYNIDSTFIGHTNLVLDQSSWGTITGTGANAAITVDGQTKTVIQALNEWVTANKATYPELKYWSWDNVNNRPIFVDSI